MATIIGTNNSDTITGLSVSPGVVGGKATIFRDFIFGMEGGDTVYAYDGNDVVYGGPGDDRLSGGAGNDTMHGDQGNDTMTGTSGGDTLYGDAGADTVSGNDGDDTLYGGINNDKVNGGGGRDTVYGDSGDDMLYGIDGNDTLYGGTGNDVLDGGGGWDLLTGGSGNDRFDFNNLSDAPVLEVGTESIRDFGNIVGNNDVIDISTIDANPLQAGNQAFSFIGSADFTAIGQISFRSLVRSTVLEFNTDADADSEAWIFVTGGELVFNANDFIL